MTWPKTKDDRAFKIVVPKLLKILPLTLKFELNGLMRWYFSFRCIQIASHHCLRQCSSPQRQWLPSGNVKLVQHPPYSLDYQTTSPRWWRSSVVSIWTEMIKLSLLSTTFWRSKTPKKHKKQICLLHGRWSTYVKVGGDNFKNNCARFSEIDSFFLRSWTYQPPLAQLMKKLTN